MTRRPFSYLASRLAAQWRHHAKRFCRSDRGVAAVEAALVLPLMVFIIIGTIEVYQYFRAATILDRTAHTLASGISIQRELLDRGRCTEAIDICTYGAIANDLTTPLDFSERGSVVFSVYAATEPRGKASQPVSWEKTPTWRRGYGAAAQAQGTQPASRLDPPNGFPNANLGDTVLVVEVFYNFEPFALSAAFWEALGGERRIYSRAFFRPRFSDIRELGN